MRRPAFAQVAAALLATLLVVSVLVVTGCGAKHESTWATLRGRGYEPTASHRLLALKYREVQELHSRSSFGGAFLFAIGGIGGSSSSDSKLVGYVGFIMDGGHGRAYMLRFPAEMIDYSLDRDARVPRVRLQLRNDRWLEEADKGDSTTAYLEAATKRVEVSLAPADFSRDVAVLEYAGRQG